MAAFPAATDPVAVVNNLSQEGFPPLVHPPSPRALKKSFASILSSTQENNLPERTPGIYHGEPAAVFTLEDIDILLQPLNFVLVGKFSSGCPKLEFIKKFFNTLGLKNGFKIGGLDHRHVIIHLFSELDYSRIFSRYLWKIEGKEMRVLKWTKDFDITAESSFASVWVTLPGLPYHFFDKVALHRIATVIGRPLRMDEHTSKISRPSLARFSVEFDLKKPKPERIWIGDASQGFWQKVVFEDPPDYCSFCSHLGHSEINCWWKPENSGKKKERLLKNDSRNVSKSVPVAPSAVVDPVVAPRNSHNNVVVGKWMRRDLNSHHNVSTDPDISMLDKDVSRLNCGQVQSLKSDLVGDFFNMEGEKSGTNRIINYIPIREEDNLEVVKGNLVIQDNVFNQDPAIILMEECVSILNKDTLQKTDLVGSLLGLEREKSHQNLGQPLNIPDLPQMSLIVPEVSLKVPEKSLNVPEPSLKMDNCVLNTYQFLEDPNFVEGLRDAESCSNDNKYLSKDINGLDLTSRSSEIQMEPDLIFGPEKVVHLNEHGLVEDDLGPKFAGLELQLAGLEPLVFISPIQKSPASLNKNFPPLDTWDFDKVIGPFQFSQDWSFTNILDFNFDGVFFQASLLHGPTDSNNNYVGPQAPPLELWIPPELDDEPLFHLAILKSIISIEDGTLAAKDFEESHSESSEPVFDEVQQWKKVKPRRSKRQGKHICPWNL